MRIHRLSITAIGPFPGRHDVDFDQLSAGGLFLLEGPTGAGKSTLIDAITYGLYGTLGKALDTRLPSAHAPLAEPVIEVVFSTGAGIHRTRRTPPYQRPKKRGGGFTSQNATAKLWRLAEIDDDIGEPVASTAQEVGTEIQRLLHLDRDQFLQTVVLPQGRFSTFLRAKPDERAEVLRDVFGTAIYQQVQDQLMDMGRAARRSVTAAEGEVVAAIRAFARMLPDGDADASALLEAGSAFDTDQINRLVDGVWEAAQREFRTAAAALEGACEGEVEARKFLDTQRDLERALARRTALLNEKAVLAVQDEAVAADRDRLAAAQRAATVEASLRAHDTAGSGMERVREAVATACAELRHTADDDLADLTDLAALHGVIDDVSGQIGGLTDAATLEAGLPERRQGVAAADAALTTARAALQAQRDQAAARPLQREQRVWSLEELRRTAAPVAVAEQVAQQCRTVRDAARRAETLAAELVEAEQKVAAAGMAATAATEAEHVLRLRWIRSTAGSLAAELEDGEPCPVCGGTEHPHPAPELPDHATLEDVDDAARRCQQAVAALQDAHTLHTRIAERLRAQQGIAGHTSLADAEAALTDAEDAVVAAREVVALIEAGQEGLVDFDARTEALRARIAAEETATATKEERLRGDRQQLTSDEQRCRAAAGDFPSVAARVEQLDARLGRARRLVVTRQEHVDAERRLADATAALAEAVLAADFRDVDAARSARLGAAESVDLQQRIRQHDAALARVASGLAEDAVAALTGDEEVDVPSARGMHELHHARLMAATAAEATTLDAQQRCGRARQELAEVLEKHRRLTEDAAPVLRMGELANAGEGNMKSTTLSTFVLLRRFEDVVAAANDRLAVMSDGRFSLQRIDEREGRARRAGLGLSIRDHHTETNRDPHTLSGGETFYVSLCLALGLADIVTSEAGGISLDTLFIDEGFGSLDSDTLDGVLGELARLQADGRSVGIVSHVAELKARISERVEITRRPGGGSTLVVRA